jgi:hypothetical protein
VTRTSTDRAARSGEDELDAADLRVRQRRRFVAVVAVLALVCAVFGVLTHLQGPKLTDTQVDASAVVERSGQQLRLFSNQAIAQVDADQVEVTPAADFTVQASGDVVAVQFTDRLRYDTEYQVRVEGVSSIYQRQRSTFSTSFTTEPAVAWRIVHGADGQDDSIERAGLRGGADRTTLWSAPRIQAFEVFDSAVAVVTDDGERSTLSLVSLDGVAVETLPLPGDGDGLVTQLGADRATTTLAFSWQPAGTEQAQLWTLPLQGERTVVPVTSISGEPLSVLDWQFVPGLDSVVAQATDEQVTLIDLTGTVPPRPLGTFVALQGVALDGRERDRRLLAGGEVDAERLQRRRRHEAGAVEGQTPYRGDLVAVAATEYVQQVALPADGGASFTSLIVSDDEQEARVLFRPSGRASEIEGFSVSPNGQYLAVETADATTPTDYTYTIDPTPTDVTTTVVDIESAAVVASFVGHSPQW